LLERTSKQELDLPVEAAQIVIRPAMHRLEQLRVDAKQERFAFSHDRATDQW
jgi:hypothetical protein